MQMDPTLPALAELAAQRRGDLTVSCAETFTVGLLSQALASASGSSEWFRGGMVACRAVTSQRLLGTGGGPAIEESTAAAMAKGVAELFSSDVGIATIGVAGPEDRDGRPPGTVVIGWSVHGRARAETINFGGDPVSVRLKGTRAALARLSGALTER
jgi:nicotinamide-nucleotide amidase